ncbi:universal stress protein [Janthinobacterium sp. BJB412]|nr:universal stress protein [Janthinobacterium sp. BJB412]
MSYRTILVHVDPSKRTPERVALAAQLAMTEDAHLVGAAMTGLTQFIYQCGAVDPSAGFVAPDLSFLNECADLALAGFTAQVERLGVRSWEARRLDEDAEAGLALQARYADLVVLGQPGEGEDGPGIVATLPEYVLLNSMRPVLVLPRVGHFEHIDRHALLAWDGSLEATRALTAAIPLLRRAGLVTLALFHPSTHNSVHGEVPGADIALYLARHGVKVEVSERPAADDIGEAILSLAAELDADLIVMGGYGHARLREMVLGGATSTVLRAMTVPVLMAH